MTCIQSHSVQLCNQSHLISLGTDLRQAMVAMVLLLSRTGPRMSLMEPHLATAMVATPRQQPLQLRWDTPSMEHKWHSPIPTGKVGRLTEIDRFDDFCFARDFDRL